MRGSSETAARSISTTSSCGARDLLARSRRRASAVVRALYAADGRRVPGHQRAPAGRSSWRWSRENLFTVGDELQAIYSFQARRRGASFARVARSSTRSGASLVADAHSAPFQRCWTSSTRSFAGRLRRAYGSLLAPARATPRAGGEPSVELLLTARGGWEADERLAGKIAAGLPACPLWRQAEARALAARVAQLVDSGRARAGEIAVLLRAASDMEVYEGALAQQGLSTLATVGSFWERQQVQICWPICARWPTRWTSRRCWGCSPRRWWGSRPTPSSCSPTARGPGAAGRGRRLAAEARLSRASRHATARRSRAFTSASRPSARAPRAGRSRR